MAHYAFLDENNIITEVIVGKDETELIEGLDPETWYGQFRGQTCKRTSYNNNIRKQYAGIGCTYDELNDVFIKPKPFPSWVLNETFDWKEPLDKPKVGFWVWDEETVSWVIPPCPFPSWILANNQWTPPIPKPEEGFWKWDEETITWIELELKDPK